MNAYHKACGSNRLTTMHVTKGKKEITLDVCQHCNRVIEPYEIIRPVPIRRCLSNITNREAQKMIDKALRK